MYFASRDERKLKCLHDVLGSYVKPTRPMRRRIPRYKNMFSLSTWLLNHAETDGKYPRIFEHEFVVTDMDAAIDKCTGEINAGTPAILRTMLIYMESPTTSPMIFGCYTEGYLDGNALVKNPSARLFVSNMFGPARIYDDSYSNFRYVVGKFSGWLCEREDRKEARLRMIGPDGYDYGAQGGKCNIISWVIL